MKTIRMFAAATALCLVLPTVSFAQPGPGRGDDHRPGGPGDRHDGPRRGGPPPRPDARGPQRDMRDRHDARDDRGAGPDHAFRRGGRLPSDYRGRQYVVDDWRGHHLSSPPRGYHWVQTGADYVLVAVATGIIAQVLLGQ